MTVIAFLIIKAIQYSTESDPVFQSDKRIVQINAVQLDMPELEYLFYGKLEEVERNLRKANVKFLRIRKSLLVNTRFIKEYSADRVVLDNGREVEISKITEIM